MSSYIWTIYEHDEPEDLENDRRRGTTMQHTPLMGDNETGAAVETTTPGEEDLDHDQQDRASDHTNDNETVETVTAVNLKEDLDSTHQDITKVRSPEVGRSELIDGGLAVARGKRRMSIDDPVHELVDIEGYGEEDEALDQALLDGLKSDTPSLSMDASDEVDIRHEDSYYRHLLKGHGGLAVALTIDAGPNDKHLIANPSSSVHAAQVLPAGTSLLSDDREGSRDVVAQAAASSFAHFTTLNNTWNKAYHLSKEGEAVLQTLSKGTKIDWRAAPFLGLTRTRNHRIPRSSASVPNTKLVLQTKRSNKTSLLKKLFSKRKQPPKLIVRLLLPRPPPAQIQKSDIDVEKLQSSSHKRKFVDMASLEVPGPVTKLKNVAVLINGQWPHFTNEVELHRALDGRNMHTGEPRTPDPLTQHNLPAAKTPVGVEISLVQDGLVGAMIPDRAESPLTQGGPSGSKTSVVIDNRHAYVDGDGEGSVLVFPLTRAEFCDVAKIIARRLENDQLGAAIINYAKISPDKFFIKKLEESQRANKRLMKVSPREQLATTDGTDAIQPESHGTGKRVVHGSASDDSISYGEVLNRVIAPPVDVPSNLPISIRMPASNYTDLTKPFTTTWFPNDNVVGSTLHGSTSGSPNVMNRVRVADPDAMGKVSGSMMSCRPVVSDKYKSASCEDDESGDDNNNNGRDAHTTTNLQLHALTRKHHVKKHVVDASYCRNKSSGGQTIEVGPRAIQRENDDASSIDNEDQRGAENYYSGSYENRASAHNFPREPTPYPRVAENHNGGSHSSAYNSQPPPYTGQVRATAPGPYCELSQHGPPACLHHSAPSAKDAQLLSSVSRPSVHNHGPGHGATRIDGLPYYDIAAQSAQIQSHIHVDSHGRAHVADQFDRIQGSGNQGPIYVDPYGRAHFNVATQFDNMQGSVEGGHRGVADQSDQKQNPIPGGARGRAHFNADQFVQIPTSVTGAERGPPRFHLPAHAGQPLTSQAFAAQAEPAQADWAREDNAAARRNLVLSAMNQANNTRYAGARQTLGHNSVTGGSVPFDAATGNNEGDLVDAFAALSHNLCGEENQQSRNNIISQVYQLNSSLVERHTQDNHLGSLRQDLHHRQQYRAGLQHNGEEYYEVLCTRRDHLQRLHLWQLENNLIATVQRESEMARAQAANLAQRAQLMESRIRAETAHSDRCIADSEAMLTDLMEIEEAIPLHPAYGRMMAAIRNRGK